MNKNPDIIVETYLIPLEVPFRHSCGVSASPVSFHIRENTRLQKFTTEKVFSHYVSEEEEGGFCQEADSLREARKLLCRVVRNKLAERVRHFVPILAALADFAAADPNIILPPNLRTKYQKEILS